MSDIMQETEVHIGKTEVRTRLYPDEASAQAATAEFHARVTAIAEEMGAHGVVAVADFYIQPSEKVKPKDASMQCVLLWGCAKCSGFELSRCIQVLFQTSRDFFAGFSKGAILGVVKEIAHSAMVEKSEKSKGTGYDA